MPHVLRAEILRKSVTFTMDGTGKALDKPVNLLLAAGFLMAEIMGSIFTRGMTVRASGLRVPLFLPQ